MRADGGGDGDQLLSVERGLAHSSGGHGHAVCTGIAAVGTAILGIALIVVGFLGLKICTGT